MVSLSKNNCEKMWLKYFAKTLTKIRARVCTSRARAGVPTVLHTSNSRPRSTPSLAPASALDLARPREAMTRVPSRASTRERRSPRPFVTSDASATPRTKPPSRPDYRRLIRLLPSSVVFADGVDEIATCAICQEGVRRDVAVLGCTHSFCRTCIYDCYVHGGPKCPVCRRTGEFFDATHVRKWVQAAATRKSEKYFETLGLSDADVSGDDERRAWWLVFTTEAWVERFARVSEEDPTPENIGLLKRAVADLTLLRAKAAPFVDARLGYY